MKIKKARNYVLAIDAGLSHLGAVVFDRNSHVKRSLCAVTEKRPNETTSAGNVRRCAEITYQLRSLCRDFPPRYICAEIPHGGARNARAMSFMSMATAIIAVFCAARGIPLLQITPNEVKRLVSPGSRKSVSKDAVGKYVEEALDTEFPTKKSVREHICDAAAVFLVARKKFRPEFSTFLK